MNDIRSIDGLTPMLPRTGGFVLHAPLAEDGAVAVQDRVEFSDLAQALGSLAPDPGIRTDKVAEIREALARGDYLTGDKLRVAVQRALQDIGLEDRV